MYYTISDLKLIAIVVISFGSYFFGVLPNILGLGTKYQNSVTLSAVLCFGGGVLFATSIIHILPDIRKDLSQWSEVVFCLGYLLIYFVDVVVVMLSSKQQTESELLKREDINSYGTIEDSAVVINSESQEQAVRLSSKINCLDFGMLFAFSVHSLLEGLVIGVESTRSGVLLLFTAVCCHKLLVAFCLGAELSKGGQPLHTILPPLSVFVLGSSVGIGLGILLPESAPGVTMIEPILQGLAGGTLLYVVVTEIIPRERERLLPKYCAIVQYISLCCGFMFMAFLSKIS
ncbi:zinc/iron regulated transporter-related protein 88E [Rhodnius prolixus]|uniref:zinc/iron regulated transporter-related protein 88E n=1 Tax=Rhodnius prolixus TaxID=13249 RepID=UPI003D18F24A